VGIFDKRVVFQPFEYPQAYDFWLLQQQAHWLHTEIPMNSDIQDWNEKLTEDEKNLIINLLKSFTQVEIVIGNDYWAGSVHDWFAKPEIQMMAAAFSNMETIHAKAYAYLNESLGLEDWEAFLNDKAGKAKLDYLETAPEADGRLSLDAVRRRALSLAKFSGCAEGVQLFSSFAVALNFSRHDKLKGTGKIIEFSVKDESLHANGGCWLFRTIIDEYPQIFDESFKAELRATFEKTVRLEDDYIDSIFGRADAILDLSKQDLKEFIRHRANTKLNDLYMEPHWLEVDRAAVRRLAWFDDLILGVSHQDFFSGRVTDYAKGHIEWSIDNVFEEDGRV
jgi:ribonucleoside-diphosphate reductase beta chain